MFCLTLILCYDGVGVFLQAAGLTDVADLANVDRLSMACPALPLCGLAITEAERGLPDVNK
jgi:sulfite reductase (ferredoxin)